ncbi:lysozyme [Sphingopyxis sp. C-1]|uniref:lysozyme n=1 Tax=Sphingopyxis sp. C-1 TaxID=262667 RepID=UPI0007837EC1|nr:lysozyme [Sphingopyxis sp. C-1]
MDRAESSAKTKVIGGGLAAALLLATPFIAKWEGKSNSPYVDMVGVKTVCYGETRVVMRTYTDAECEAMLRKAVEAFAKPVADMTPTIADRPNQLAGASSFAYNVGLGGYSTSSARRLFLAGDFKAGCRAFGAWNKGTFSQSQAQRQIAKGEACTRKKNGQYLCTIKGLTNRRADETAMCMKGL